MQSDHERIWLEPGSGGPDGRMWSHDDPWTGMSDYADDGPATEYVRADLCKRSEWQKVETAPLNTDVLLGWWETWPKRTWCYEAGWAGKSNSCAPETGYSDAWRHGEATHWMPLPEPPHA